MVRAITIAVIAVTGVTVPVAAATVTDRVAPAVPVASTTTVRAAVTAGDGTVRVMATASTATVPAAAGKALS